MNDVPDRTRGWLLKKCRTITVAERAGCCDAIEKVLYKGVSDQIGWLPLAIGIGIGWLDRWCAAKRSVSMSTEWLFCCVEQKANQTSPRRRISNTGDTRAISRSSQCFCVLWR